MGWEREQARVRLLHFHLNSPHTLSLSHFLSFPVLLSFYPSLCLARRKGIILSTKDDPAAAQYKENFFNFYDKRVMGSAWFSGRREF